VSYNIQKLAIISLVGLYIPSGIEMHERKKIEKIISNLIETT